MNSEKVLFLIGYHQSHCVHSVSRMMRMKDYLSLLFIEY